jgi:subtilisin-like proprotein convertase family protein
MKQVYSFQLQQFCFAIFCIFLVSFEPQPLHAQDVQAAEIRTTETTVVDTHFPLFGELINYQHQRSEDVIQDAVFFKLNQVSLSKLMKEKNYKLQLDIPVKGRKNGLKVNLQRKNIFAPDFKVRVASKPDEVFPYEKGIYYHGSLEGTKEINAVFSIFNEEIFGWVITPEGNYTIGRMSDSPDVYTCYLDSNAPKIEIPNCGTKDDGRVYSFGELNFQSRAVGDCVKVYFEVDNSVVTAQGSVVNATNFVTNAFAQVALIYAAENILMVVSEMLVWNMADPYSGANSSAYLGQFQNIRTSINGADLGHLVSMVNNGGIAAGFDAICNPEIANRLCYSGMSGTIQNYPTVSFTPFILAHEMGHLVGSRHTHACVWNGNGTAIDGCSGTEGGCPSPGLPAGGGTIMSYCINTGVGLDFNQGFGPQPSAVIQNSIAGADCLTSDCSACDVEFSSVVMTPNTECEDTPNGSLTMVGTSSNGPFEYSISGPVTSTNMTGIFTNLPNGIYTIAVSDLGTNGCKTIAYQNVNIASTDVPKVIPLSGNISSTLNFPSDDPITGIKVVGLQIHHSWIGDLSATLTSPEGTVISLFTRPGHPAASLGCDWKNMYLSFSDDAALTAANLEATCELNSYAIFGEYQSITPLNGLIGENPMGNWTLSINDALTPDGGMVLNWGLELCAECAAPVVITCNSFNIAFNGESSIPLNFADLATASSACGLATTTLNPTSIDCEDIGSSVFVTATATDINGNSNSCVSLVSVTGLPCGWTQQPNGINCPGGSQTSYNGVNDQFTIQANNCYYGNPFNSQSLALATHSLCGNGTITAQVVSMTGNGFAGINIRETNTPGSKMVSLMTNLQNFHRREARLTTNGLAMPQILPSLNRFWLRLVRQGNLIIGYTSANGVNWSMAMQVQITMANCIQVGLVATGASPGDQVTAIFGNVSVAQAMLRPVGNGGFEQSGSQGLELLNMYPNPGSDIISLKWSEMQKSGWEIIVTDALGRVIKTEQGGLISDNYHELDMSKVSAGLYFVKCITQQHGEIVKKLVIQR